MRRALAALLPEALFAGMRWYRRARGGHWERWWIDGVHADLWFATPHGGERPGMARGTPTCEDWP